MLTQPLGCGMASRTTSRKLGHLYEHVATGIYSCFLKPCIRWVAIMHSIFEISRHSYMSEKDLRRAVGNVLSELPQFDKIM